MFCVGAVPSVYITGLKPTVRVADILISRRPIVYNDFRRCGTLGLHHRSQANGAGRGYLNITPTADCIQCVFRMRRALCLHHRSQATVRVEGFLISRGQIVYNVFRS